MVENVTKDFNQAACDEAVLRIHTWAAHVVRKADLNDPYFVSQGLYKGLLAFNAVNDQENVQRLINALKPLVDLNGDFHPRSSPSMIQAMTKHSSHRGSNLFNFAMHDSLNLALNYRNAWLTCGAFTVGADMLGQRGALHLTSVLHSKLGAIPNCDRGEPDHYIYDVGSNASAVLAFLAAKQNDNALRVGFFLRQMVMRQDATQLCLALDAYGNPLSLENTKNKTAQGLYFFSIGAPQQVYWVLGFALRAFAALYRETRQSEWLTPTLRIRQWLKNSHADQFTQITSAKLGWGAADLFALTGDDDWQNIALQVVSHILKTQTSTGIWIRPDFPSKLLQPLLVSLDTSLERMYYLREIPRTLSEGGSAFPHNYK